ncbi:hypothetical protein BN1723_010505 [Verticillium longisporum]|uniref:Rhodopsin domain-containing protein n=1 Tax=Verticillium longisporum TaxID=100787 RepID=A0A0G4KYT2_VERLO|nr:hypothetical protein BN1723_010505 [Verticillium longisporum]
MQTLIPPHFVLEEVTSNDLVIASLAWGFTIGFGWLTTSKALKQTKQTWKRQKRRTFRNAYVWMIWLEILVCLIFGVICFLYLLHFIPPSFAFYFTILPTWALQVQFLLQIIVNRCAILLSDPKHSNRIKIGVAVLITAVNISDRVEKAIYLLVDGTLNIYFIRIVKHNLIVHGLTKYKTLTRFYEFIVCFSLSMDVLIIAMMSLPNTFVYMQFHPLTYIVKLNIEMIMADLIGKIARNRNCGVISEGTFNSTGCDSTLRSANVTGTGNRDSRGVFDYESGFGGGITAQMGTTGKSRMGAVSLEQHSFRLGAVLDDEQGGIVERHRLGTDADKFVTRSVSYNSQSGSVLDAPREVYHYGSYGVGLRRGNYGADSDLGAERNNSFKIAGDAGSNATRRRGSDAISELTAESGEGGPEGSRYKIFIADVNIAIIVDLVIVLVPISVIWSMRLPLRETLRIILMLIVGTLTIGVAVFWLVKVVMFVNSEDVTADFVVLDLTACIELSIGIVCACLPSAHCLYELYKDR